LKKLFGLALTLGVLSASCTKTEIRYVEVSTTAPDIDETNSAASSTTAPDPALSSGLLLAAASCLDSMPMKSDWREQDGLIGGDPERNLQECRGFRVASLAEESSGQTELLLKGLQANLQKYLDMIVGVIDRNEACSRYYSPEARGIDEFMCWNNWLVMTGRVNEYRLLSESIIDDLELILE
jgi:hypothetical protein